MKCFAPRRPPPITPRFWRRLQHQLAGAVRAVRLAAFPRVVIAEGSATTRGSFYACSYQLRLPPP
jgi:hypothetical protein